MLHCARVVLYAGLLALSPALLADTATPPATSPAASKLKAIEAMMSRSEVDEAIEAAEAWTEAEPNSADAWYMLGRTNGNKATRVNMFSAAGLAGDSREAYEKAVELDPGHVRARYDLIQFYMMAPGFMGGSEEKAAEMAAALEKLDAVWGNLGRAYIGRVFLLDFTLYNKDVAERDGPAFAQSGEAAEDCWTGTQERRLVAATEYGG